MKSILTFLILLESSAITIAQNYGAWSEIDSMSIPRIYHSMVELPDGNILVSGTDGDSIQSSAEIYDFTMGKWRYTTPMNVPRSQHNLVLLNTGKVMAIGGYKERSCELFDPETETWTMTDSIPTYRYFGQTVTTLNNGNIFICGGMFIDTATWDSHILRNVEIYNLELERWTEVAPMNLGRMNHTATLLSDGKVLVVGGLTDNLTSNKCEIYDPLLDTWEVVAPMSEKRSRHAAILLNNGNVFVSGGGNDEYPLLNSCEVYNVNSNEWTSADNMLFYRKGHHIYYLKSFDKLLILGSGTLEFGEETWEIYDPNSLEPLYYEAFPIKQILGDNNIQLSNENIFVAGGWEYFYFPLLAKIPTRRTWIFDVLTDVVEGNGNYVKDFHLGQNYPNPFNPSTTISYTLASSSSVKLVVYNTLGKEVAVLVNREQSSGTYTVNFDAKNLSSGIYFYSLISETTVITKSMILLK